jgi:Leucine-rich repeat (LRR) protein
MLKNYSFLFLLIILFGLNSCSKEEFVKVLKEEYEPVAKEAEFTGEDFIVNLNASALQVGESGQWKILSGPIVEEYVYFEDKANPFTRFKGIPGEEYTLEWKRQTSGGKTSAVQTKVKIPELVIEITDITGTGFETIKTLVVDPKYKGTWSFDSPYGYLNSRYHDGYAEPPEKKPSIELHGYANTNYTATYTYTYAGKEYQFKKVIKTGDYAQEEGLFELQLSGGSGRVIKDNLGNVLELNLQASGIAWIFNEPNTYPALQAFKKIRKLILGGSSLTQISTIFGDYYPDLEDLDLDGVGENLVFPESFGNLRKLKTLIVNPRFSDDGRTTVVLPKSFANLKALEYFTTKSMKLDFNGTLGGLTSLKSLKTTVATLPENIGDLKQLQEIDVFVENASFPERFSECRSLKFARVYFYETGSGTVKLSSKIGDLKNLEFLDITSNKLRELPATLSALPALKILKISALNLQSIPENIGNLANLEDFSIYGAYNKIPNSFGDLKKLNFLFLGGYATTLPESFGNLSSLTYFNASSTELKTLPKSFGNLKKLKEIVLDMSKIEVLPESFGELDALETLKLSQTQLKTFPKQIIPLKSIREVMFSGTNVGDIPEEISTMKTGVTFSMYLIPNLTQEHLEHIVSITKGKVFQTSFGYYTSSL